MDDILPGAEPFFFPGGPVGALLIHGFTGAAREVRPVGEALAAAGYTALGVRLTHHGTQPADMLRSHWRDWYLAALDGYYLLRAQCQTVFVMGLSMGGALSLYLAAHYPVAGVVAMSTPCLPLVKALDRPARFASLLSYFRPFWPKGPPDPDDDSEHVAYPNYPVRAVVQLRALLRALAVALPDVRAPALLVHSRGDTSVAAENLEYIHQRLGSAEKQVLWLKRCGHIVTEGSEQALLFERVLAFVRAHAAAPDPADKPTSRTGS